MAGALEPKEAGKLHDFLMNPKSRPDLQTPEAQAFLRTLQERFHNDKTDALMPWLAREWKKGRLQMDSDQGDPLFHSLFYTAPHGRDAPLRAENLNHWADFLRSNHPLRRDMGDIMKHDITSFNQRVHDWDTAMKDAAHQQALQGGQVVHQDPEGWSVRQLTTPEELSAEGNAMGHCVGGYGGMVQRGDSLIYSLRDPNNSPHVTAEIRPRRWQDPSGPDGTPGRIWGEGEGAGDPKDFNMTPVPHGGEITQIQGKSNQEPIDEYKARLAPWFKSFPPADRPTWYDDGDEDTLTDAEGYSHYRLDHPDLIPEYERQKGTLEQRTVPYEDKYGLRRQPGKIDADYTELMDNIKLHDYGGSGSHPDSDHINDIYRLAAARGEIPDYAQALEGYQEGQQSNFDEWMDQNYQFSPRWPDPDAPEGWEDEEGAEVDEGQGRPYWTPNGSGDGYGGRGDRYHDYDEAEKAYEEAYASWESEHGGMKAATQLYGLLQPHFGAHPGTGEQGYWNEVAPPQPPPPQQPNTFSKVAGRTHPHFTGGYPCSCSFGKLRRRAMAKTASKIDWLVERKDKFSQTPEGQKALQFLQEAIERNPKIDDLAPWLYREAKKRNVTLGDRTFYVNGPNEQGRQVVLDQVTPPMLDHWADWFDSNSPTRRGVDIMQLPAHDMLGRVQAWDAEMQQKMEDARTKEGSGQVVHRFDDGWTVRRLRDAAEAREEGNAMGHCVGSYGHEVESGSSQIFSLRDPENGPHATMEIHPEDRYRTDPADYVIPEHVWSEVPHHNGLSIDRLGDLHDADQMGHPLGSPMPRTDSEQAALDDFRRTYGHVPLEGGKVVQTQGKSNQSPLSEYTEKLDEWLHPHGLESYKPWWDDYYTQDGPEDFEGLLGHAGEQDDNVFGYDYPTERRYEAEPEDYRHAEGDAEERGIPGPELYYTDPDYEKILRSLIDPAPVHRYVADPTPEEPHRRKGVMVAPWKGYNPEAGQYVYNYAAEEHPVVSRYDGVPQFREGEEEGEGPAWQRYQQAHHLEALHEALKEHIDDARIDPWPGSEDDYDHILDPRERQNAMHQDAHDYYVNEYGDVEPWMQMFNHLGPQLDPGFQPIGTPAQYSGGIHPFQEQLWDQSGAPYQHQLPQGASGPLPNVFTKVASPTAPLYKRWAFSPATGQVELSDNTGDPIDVRYHGDLAREINEPNLVHGYAYRIGSGWRLTDWDSKPLSDPYIVAQVMRRLQTDQVRSAAVNGSWEQDREDDWTRIHHGLPT